MRIHFIPNPKFTPAQPEIKVGSVVQLGNNHRAVVVKVDESFLPFQIAPRSPDNGSWFMRDDLKSLPERVCGWDEKGPMFEPMVRPTPQFTWEQYPPRPGMVVECNYLRESGADLRLIIGTVGGWYLFDSNGAMWQQADTTKLKDLYLPRPDLMPQLVEGE